MKSAPPERALGRFTELSNELTTDRISSRRNDAGNGGRRAAVHISHDGAWFFNHNLTIVPLSIVILEHGARRHVPILG